MYNEIDTETAPNRAAKPITNRELTNKTEMPWGRRVGVSVEEITYMSLWCTFLGVRSVDGEKLLLNSRTFKPEDPAPYCLEHGRTLFRSPKEAVQEGSKGLGNAICFARD